MIEGVFTALITPFNEEGSLNEKGLRILLEKQIQAQVHGIVLLGTTGEAPTLKDPEKAKILKIARACIPPSIKYIVGTGTYSTATTIEATKQAYDAGADAALVVTPYYNKPTQEGLFKHFEALALSTCLPLIIYNIQGRTAQNLQTETLKRLLAFKNIVSVKEASGQISQMMDVIASAKNHKEFSILSGDDNLTLALMALGGHGVISVLSNLIPEKIVSLYQACKNNDWEQARALHYALLPLFKGAFIETNPAPIKQLMAWHDLPSGYCRLPLSPLSEASLKQLHQCLYG
jgi:4-hydroxy-tetrahydrodipicolinate synthase